MRRSSTLLTVGLWLAPLGLLPAQEIPRPDYFTYMPGGMPLPTTQSLQTAQFQLYGDTSAASYVDRDPRNGIDDRRDAWLKGLAVRFAPWMIRNTVDFPMDWRRFVNQGPSFPLFVDVFQVSTEHPRLERSETIDMKGVASVPCTAADSLVANDTTPDCRLLSLLERYGPDRRPAPRPVAPGEGEAKVLFFDFPGTDPQTWNDEFEGPVKGTISRRYIGWAKTSVHPFIAPVPGRPENDPRYQLVLQYWLFYPYNDAGNVHEGDWEHINILVTTPQQGGEPFTAAQMEALVNGMTPVDQFLIREVQYYFHHWVFTVDYFFPNVYLPRDEWQKQVDNAEPERFGEKKIWEQVRNQVYMNEEETEFNHHPLIFIGGDNRGLQQLIAKPTRLGRASHGSYPFPGLYKDVGPQGTGELVQHRWDRFRTPPDSNAPESEPIVRLDNPDRIELLPDWERIQPLAFSEAQARADWAWMLLPIRFGYPATISPFAGIVRYAETGNLSIPGPPFNGGWNRSGIGPGYDDYQPHRLSSYFPASLQDNFQTGWGFFNLTVPTLVTLPGFDIVFRLVSAPFRATSKSIGPAFFNSQTVPFRFVGVSGGVSTFQPGEDWLGLLLADQLGFALIDSMVQRSTSGEDLVLGSANIDIERATQWVVGINLYLGRKVVSESSLRHSRSSMGFDVTENGVPAPIPVVGSLDFWEYVGSIRYNLAVNSFQPFIKGGYGLSWYQLQDVTFDGNPLGPGESAYIRKPSLFNNLLPNTWHLGVGAEYVPLRSVGGLDFGVKADVAVHTHNLGVKPRDGSIAFVQDRRIYRWVGTLTGNLSF